MAEYNPNRRCPKCHGAARTAHDPVTDQMVRKCVRCGYSWREVPKDGGSGKDFPLGTSGLPAPGGYRRFP